jgi:2,3-bisphosphoglycerate-dependent phosphoglycerate mutase
MVDTSHYTLPVLSWGTLILVRHAESEWNRQGRWTGLTDVHLSNKGIHDADLLGKALKDITIDIAYCSEQVRTLETLQRLLKSSHNESTKIRRSDKLNERDYGVYTGLNKWEVMDKVGKNTFTKIRRSWDYPILEGETLAMVFARLIPYYRERIVPEIMAGSTVIVASHGNTLRSLLKYLESIDDNAISVIEMPFDAILLYAINEEGRARHKSVRTIDITPTEA